MTQRTAVPLYWVSYGSSDHTLLALHGGPGAQHDYLLPQMLELARKHTLMLYDQRGGGRSRMSRREDITWEDHAADLAALVDEHALDPLTLVGYSWGGLLALLYAASAAERPELGWPLPARLVLVSPAPATEEYRRRFQAELARRQQAPELNRQRQVLSESGLSATDPELYRRRLFELGVAGYFHDPSRAAELTSFRVMGRVQDSVWSSLGSYDLTASLSRLRIPTLVVHGRDDPIPLPSSLGIAEAMHARMVVLEDCGHVPYVEQPLLLFEAIQSFLGDTTAGIGSTTK